jgi:membrane-associated phospholipid phosphatase
VALGWQRPQVARWQGAVLLDDPARTALLADRHGAQRRAALASDVLLVSLIAYPVIDAAVAMVTERDRVDVGWQMTLIDAQAMAFAQLVGAVIKRATARERPYVAECAGGGEHHSCNSTDRNQSFYSGHTGTSFTAAGLTCAHHLALPLYGGGAADRLACATAVGAAATVGTLRVVADEHYLTDVLVGAGVGLAFGYALPALLHYRIRASRRSTRNEKPITVMPMVSPQVVGLSVSRPL